MASSLIDFVKAREGYAKAIGGGMYTAYWDPNGKVWTIGPGITGPEIRKGTVWMKARCDAALEQKLAEARAQLLALSPGVAWPPGGEDSLTDFVYNVGSGHYEHSDVRKCALAGDWPGVKAHLLDWESAGGKRLGGLVTRREGEAAMIQTPARYNPGRSAALRGPMACRTAACRTRLIQQPGACFP